MTLPIERFKDTYQNWRWNPFTDADMAINAEEDELLIPAGAPFVIQLLEQPRYNDPTTVVVRCYGVSTTVDETSAAGQKVLKVTATAGFAPGDTVIINRAGDREEEKVVDTVQAGISLTMTVNLAFEHTAVQADVVEKYIAFAEAGGAPAQSQFRVDYPPDDGGEGTGLIEFNQNDAEKEVRVNYKATGSPALAETLDTKISYPANTPGNDQIVGFTEGVPGWRDFAHALVGAEHTAAGLTIGHVVRASGAAAFAWAQLQHGDLGGVTANQHHAQAHSLASHSSKTHAELTGVGANDHHPQSHSLASHSSKAHSELTGVTANLHHPQSHSLASHSTKAHAELTGVTANLHHAQVHAMASHSDFATYLNQAVLTTSNVIHNNGLFNGKFSFGTPGELTIAGGTITVTSSYHTVDTQGDNPTDNLDTINGGVDGQILILTQEAGARDVTCRDSNGNMQLNGNFTFGSILRKLYLFYSVRDNKWIEWHRF